MIAKTSEKNINYDEIAYIYDKRYERAYRPEGVTAALSDLARDIGVERILEVGCGTGHWLSVLQAIAPRVFGMDFSQGMLKKALHKKGAFC